MKIESYKFSTFENNSYGHWASGADTFVTLNLAGIDVVSRLRGDVSLQSGEQASFVVNMDKVVLFDPVTEKRLDI